MDKALEKRKLKEHIIKYLNLLSITPEEIGDDMPLFQAGLGLDSIDSIELVVLMEREYGIKIENPKEGRKILVDVNTMIDYIDQHRANVNLT
jgi:acyl carrier protein